MYAIPINTCMSTESVAVYTIQSNNIWLFQLNRCLGCASMLLFFPNSTRFGKYSLLVVQLDSDTSEHSYYTQYECVTLQLTVSLPFLSLNFVRIFLLLLHSHIFILLAHLFTESADTVLQKSGLI